MYRQTIRNRNRRVFGYGAGAAGLGIANAVTSNNKRSYSGPSGRMSSGRRINPNAAGIINETRQGVGRNA